MRKTRALRGARSTVDNKRQNGSACAIDWENHREYDAESDAIVRARAVECCRPGRRLDQRTPGYLSPRSNRRSARHGHAYECSLVEFPIFRDIFFWKRRDGEEKETRFRFWRGFGRSE